MEANNMNTKEEAKGEERKWSMKSSDIPPKYKNQHSPLSINTGSKYQPKSAMNKKKLDQLNS
jgi:hypothetical protein